MSLTRYSPGSLKELMSLSVPLMLTSLSFFFMIFIDRLFLAAFDLEAMTAAVSASIVGVTCLSGLGIIASIAEVYVGRRYGAGEFKTLGSPVWQMLWLSLFTFFPFLFFGLYGSSFVFGEGRELEAIYFKWMLLCAPASTAYPAIAAFFIGQGKTKVIVYTAVATNALNIFLDFFLIFGVEGWIEPLGIEGAAIATSIGALFQALCLFFIFIGKKNRERFGTSDWKFNYPLFKEGVLIGVPAGVAVMIELGGWSLFYEMMKYFSPDHITIAGIFQSLLMLFFFIPEGLHKGMVAIIANYIGEKREEIIPKVIFSGLKLMFFVFLVALMLSPLAVDGLRKGFLGGHVTSLETLLFGGWLTAVFYVIFEGLRVINLSLLTAYKETSYILYSGVFSVVMFIGIPFSLCLWHGQPSELTALSLAVLFPLGHALVLFARSRFLLTRPLALSA